MYLQCLFSCHEHCQKQQGILLFGQFLIVFPSQKSIRHLNTMKDCYIEVPHASELSVNTCVAVELFSHAKLLVPPTDAVVIVTMTTNVALCFKTAEPVLSQLASPMLPLEDNDNWLGLPCRICYCGCNNASFDSALACRPGPGCWLLAPRRPPLSSPSRPPAAAVVTAFAGVCALGPLIGTGAPNDGSFAYPLLLPAGRLADNLRIALPPTTPLRPPPPPWAAAAGAACLLEVPAGDRWGAAVALGGRLAVTCAHLVASATEVRLLMVSHPASTGGRWRRARVLWASDLSQPQPVLDVAFLELLPPVATSDDSQLGLPRLRSAEASLDGHLTGQQVAAVGFPFQGVSRACPMLSCGHLVHEFGGLLPSNECLTVAYQTSCPVFNGFSGGPVILSDGRVVAMTVGHLRLHSPDRNCHDISLSIPMNLLQSAADRYNETNDAEVAFKELSVPPSVHRAWIWHTANGLLVQHNPTIRPKL